MGGSWRSFNHRQQTMGNWWSWERGYCFSLRTNPADDPIPKIICVYVPLQFHTHTHPHTPYAHTYTHAYRYTCIYECTCIYIYMHTDKSREGISEMSEWEGLKGEKEKEL